MTDLTSTSDDYLIGIYQYQGPENAYKIQAFLKPPFSLNVMKQGEGADSLPYNWMAA